MKKNADKYFKLAIEQLSDANDELYRPNEDVVSFLVCKNAQHAIENYLRGYLYEHDVDASVYITIDSLYQQCKKINRRFNDIDLTDFNCKIHDTNTRFCNEVSKVSRCFEIADSLDTFLREEKVIHK